MSRNENNNLMELPFGVEIESNPDGGFKILIKDNKLRYCLRDCIQMLAVKDWHDGMVERIRDDTETYNLNH